MVSRKVLYWLLGAIAINRLCSLVPKYVYIDPFPFYTILDKNGNEIGITLQSYIHGISMHLIVMVLMFLLSSIAKYDLGKLIAKFFWLEVLSLLDYFLIFEHPIFNVLWGIEFTDFKLAFYSYFILTWKTK